MTDPSPFLTRRAGACEIFLIRHGDATPEPDSFIADHYDRQPLNALGRQQAVALARHLKDMDFAALYSSPLLRCVETIQPLTEAKGMTFALVPNAREIMHDADARRANGQNASEYVGSFLDGGVRIGAYAMQHGTFDGLPGAEPRAQFRARVREAHDQLAARHAGQRIAVVSHGGVINVYAAVMLGLERDFFMPIRNTAISIVRVQGERRMLVSLNDVGHLREVREHQSV
jgi:broad specificity phosphatase PhoE